MNLFLIKYYIIQLKFLVNRKLFFKRKIWNLGLIEKSNFKFIKKYKFKMFWADPFPIEYSCKHYVFFEEMNFNTQLGEIAYLELDTQHNILQKQTVLKNNTHFSFPNVFEYEGAHYMLPENVQSNQLVIYKAHDFPNDWRPYKVLMNNIKLLDPIWFYHEGYYWIMGNKIHEFEYENNNSLYVYFAKDLFAQDWTSHPMNPVVIDSEFARNAGKVIQKDAQLIRVSQNCSQTYGSNVNFMQIKELTPTNYIEILIDVFMPPKGTKGLHTYNEFHNLAWVDVLIND